MAPYDSSSESTTAEPTQIKSKDEKNEKYKYVCSKVECKMRFMRLDGLDKHEFSHTGIKRHNCHFDDCDKSYVILTHLKRHILRSHQKIEKEKNYPCTICEKKFISEYNLQRHIKMVHENPKIYSCPYCNEKFKRKFLLRRHSVVHSGDFPYKCEKCGKGFLNLKSFTQHSRNHCKYDCEDCKKIFKNWSELVGHRRAKHPSIYKCKTCNLEFRYKFKLKRHEEYHKNDNERTALKCSWEGCDKYYYHLQNLNYHIKIKHEGKTYNCTNGNCEKSFLYKKSLEKHLKSHESSNKKPKEKKSTKKKRSDLGKKKISSASILAGISTNPHVEKSLIEGRGSEIIVEGKSFSEVSDTDGEGKIVTTKAIIRVESN